LPLGQSGQAVKRRTRSSQGGAGTERDVGRPPLLYDCVGREEACAKIIWFFSHSLSQPSWGWRAGDEKRKRERRGEQHHVHGQTSARTPFPPAVVAVPFWPVNLAREEKCIFRRIRASRRSSLPPPAWRRRSAWRSRTATRSCPVFACSILFRHLR